MHGWPKIALPMPCQSVLYLPFLCFVAWQDVIRQVREDGGHPCVSVSYGTHRKICRARLSQDFRRNLPPNFIILVFAESCRQRIFEVVDVLPISRLTWTNLWQQSRSSLGSQ
ncbi:unnamed protein product [Prunus armeniaca]